MKIRLILLSCFFVACTGLCAQSIHDTCVVINTNKGVIKIKLYDQTPLHRANFIKLVYYHYFDSVLFHRVIQDFMIQGGDPDSKHAPSGVLLGNGGPAYTIPAEFNPVLFHKKGVLAAARTGDDENPLKASSGSQFYIVQGKKYTPESLMRQEAKMNKKREAAKLPLITFTQEQMRIYESIGGTPSLDMNYTVFGEVAEGLDIVDKIAGVKTDVNDRPLDDVVIISTALEVQ